MKSSSLKKILLAGTALVAVGTATPARAADLVLNAADIWADGGGGPLGAAAAGDNVDVNTFVMTITDDGTADDGGGIGVFNIGTVTDTNTGTAGTGGVTVTSTNGEGDVTVTLKSVNVAGNFKVIGVDADNISLDVTVTNDLTIGKGLTLSTDEADAADPVSLEVNGDISVTGASVVAAGNQAGADATLTIAGDAAFTNDLSLNDGTNGNALLVFDGAAAQIVSGDIDGAVAGEGTIRVSNANGVSFSGDVGGNKALDTIILDTSASNASATFETDVGTANGIVLGAGAGKTATATFDSSDGAMTVTGEVDGDGLATANVVVTGTNTVTFSDKVGGTNGIDALTIASSATADFDADVQAAIRFTGTGTADFADGLTITGTIDNTSGTAGRGTLVFGDTGTGTTVTGNVGATNSLAAITISQAAGSVTFQGTVNATTTTLDDTSSVEFEANATTNVDLAGGGEAVLAAGKTLTGSVDNTSGVAAKGFINVFTTGGTSTITGDIGDTQSLEEVTITGTGTAAFGGTLNAADINVAAASTTTFADDVTTANGLDINNQNATLTIADGANFTGNIFSTGGANGTLNFSGSSTVTGQVGLAAGTGISALKVNGAGGTVSISGNSFVGTITGVAGSTLSLGGDTKATGAVTNGGTIGVAVGKTLTGASFAGAGTYSFSVEDDGDGVLNAVDFGRLASAGAIDLAAETVTFDFTGVVAEGAAVVWSSGGAAAVTAATVTDNSILYEATLGVAGNDHTLTVARADIADVVTSPNAVAIGTVLDSLAATTDPELLLVLDSIASAGTAEELEEVLESVAPTVDGGAVAAGLASVGQTSTVTQTRLAMLRDGTAETGMAAGNIAQGLKAWVQGFGTNGTQEERDNVDGYDLSTLGVAVGLDTENILEDWIFGVAFSYSDSEVESDNATSTLTDIGTYQATLYGNVDLSDRSYVSGQLAYAWGTNESTRYDVGGVAGLDANGEYDSSTIAARVETGRDYKFGRNTTLTPNVSANYVGYSADGYTETGAGGASLTVDNEDVQLLELGVGVNATWLNRFASGAYFKPRVHTGIRHDLIGDNIQSTASFTGGGATFETEGFDPATTTLDLGTGFTYYGTSNWEFTGDYNYEVKSDFDAHSGVLRASYHF